MARTAVQRWITFNPSSRLTAFFGVGYSTKGVAVAPLNSLLPIYPSRTILQLALLKRFFLPKLKELVTLMLIPTSLPSWLECSRKSTTRIFPQVSLLKHFPPFLPICSPTKLQRRDMHSRQTSPHYLLTQTITFWR
jgi:hypothetical protein